MQKDHTPFLWFDTQAEESRQLLRFPFFREFPGFLWSRRYGEAGPGPKGTVMDGPRSKSTGSNSPRSTADRNSRSRRRFSFVVSCETQAEIDAPVGGNCRPAGKESRCGWLKDRYGLSWQLVPTVLPELLGDKDSARVQRAMQAIAEDGQARHRGTEARAHQGAA